MSVTIGPYTFDRVDYDDLNDVLYLGEGPIGEDTEPGTVFMYADNTSTEVLGAILVSPRRQIDRNGSLPVTLPDGDVVDATASVAAACRCC